MKKEFPILEFDTSKESVIDVKKNIKSELLPKRCVISFFGDAVKSIVNEKNAKQISSLVLETFELPIYLVKDKFGKEVALIHALGSGPYAAGQLEKLSAMGCKKFIVCGGSGVLQKGSNLGDLFVPKIALRDEGTSYHYLPPSRDIKMNEQVFDYICSYLEKEKISYKPVKTWTTDAMYRETKDMINLRKSEGCAVVEMECASFFAVAEYKNLQLGQILYAGDDLSGKEWNSRDWKGQHSIREKVLLLAIDICGEL